jgi:ribosome-binding factor A
MRSYARSVRIAELFQREIADILMRKVGDPRLEGVTITRIEVSNDLKLATVFLMYGQREEMWKVF